MGVESEGVPYHRIITTHNPDEFELVQRKMEVWGGETRQSAGAMICVQAFPGVSTQSDGYSFGCEIRPVEKLGFRGRETYVREVAWYIGMPGVQEREDGKFACVPICWVRR